MTNIIPLDFIVTIAVFYWAYLILVGIYLVMGFFCVYHLVRFGFFSFANIFIIAVFIGVSAWLIWYSLFILAGFDWSLPIFDPNWFSNMSGVIGTFSNPANLPSVKF